MFKSTGRILYDPPRPGMKRRTQWWAIVSVDREITRYMRYWINQQRNPLKLDGHDLCQPSWDAHISIVRGEQPRQNEHLWRKYHGQKIDFYYDHNVRQSGDTTGWDRPNHFYFINVDCPFLDQIRQELGLITNWRYHLTIGRTYD